MIYLSRDDVERIGRAGASYDGQKARWLSSFWLHLEPQDTAFTPHWMEGYWESWITKWVSTELPNNDMFIDVGANVGYYTFMAASTGIPVIAYEPNPDVYALLEKSATENSFRTPVVMCNAALSDKFGSVTLSVPEGHSGAGSIAADMDGSVHYTVPCGRLDQQGIQEEYQRILIKVDAEGAEPQIWAGMSGLRNRKLTVFLEWAPSRYEDAGAFADELLQYNVSLINYQGIEEPIQKHHLLGVQDWITIVVRN